MLKPSRIAALLVAATFTFLSLWPFVATSHAPKAHASETPGAVGLSGAIAPGAGQALEDLTAAAADAASGMEIPDLLSEISSRHPLRKTGSYEARLFLSHLAGTLQLNGWHTKILPYTNVVKTVSEQEKSVVYLRVTGENLLALESDGAKNLDYLIVAPYDNLFSDNPEDILASSPTLVSTALALRVSQKLDRESLEAGVAFVSGHYQGMAGILALCEFLEEEGITVGTFLILGDILTSSGLDVGGSPAAPVSFLETLFEEARSMGLGAHFPENLRNTQTPLSGTVSPSSPLGRGLQVEGFLLGDLERPLVTVGLLYGDLGHKLNQDLLRDDLGIKVERAADAVATALGKAPGTGGPKLGETRRLLFWGRVFFLPPEKVFMWGFTAAALLAVIAFARLPKEASGILLTLGTCAAAAASMLLHVLFTTRAAQRYASDVFPGRSLLLFFVVFALLVLCAFLRLWNVRSRIHHLRQRSGMSEQGAGEKKSWGSPWSLAVLSALIAGTAYKDPEMLPPLVAAGISHGIATLLLKASPEDMPPHAVVLWLARVLYLVPLLAVFWAGSPLDPIAQAAYRASWTGLNRGSMVSALCLGATAASVLSTFRAPRPVPQRFFRLISLFEVLSLALTPAAGFLLSAQQDAGPRAWAVVEETYDVEPSFVLSAPIPVRELALVDEVTGESKSYRNLSGIRSLPVEGGDIFDWADITRGVFSSEEPEAQEGLRPGEILAHFELARSADAVSLQISESVGPRITAQGFTLHGLDTLLGCSPDDLGGETSLVLPAGYTVTVIWWNTADFTGSLKYSARSAGMATLDHRLRAVYFDTSYGGVYPLTEGVVYYRLTSLVRRYYTR
ncbi:MAG TPA: hypothetical protein GX500_08770 [Firmicutes bacterium]|nr:hypothetical protein [Candidatus Fermentithermobacillaceae bacterium]